MCVFFLQKKGKFLTEIFSLNHFHLSCAFVNFRSHLKACMCWQKGLGVVSPPFTPCMQCSFHPPDGTPLLLNENDGTLQSDTPHPSKTSSVPHPKARTVQDEKTFIMMLSVFLQFKTGFSLAQQPLIRVLWPWTLRRRVTEWDLGIQWRWWVTVSQKVSRVTMVGGCFSRRSVFEWVFRDSCSEGDAA